MLFFKGLFVYVVFLGGFSFIWIRLYFILGWLVLFMVELFMLF